MTDWKTDSRPENTRRFGDIALVSETHKVTRATAHLITLPQGSQIRVLPDDRSGQKRSRLVSQVLEDASRIPESLVGADGALVETYVIGGLAREGLEWERVGNVREETFEEWLTAWFGEEEAWRAETLLAYLKADGWEVRRAE